MPVYSRFSVVGPSVKAVWFNGTPQVQGKAVKFAQLIRQSRHLVVFTGQVSPWAENVIDVDAGTLLLIVSALILLPLLITGFVSQ